VPATSEFQLFGPAHLITVGLILGGGLLFSLWARRRSPRSRQRLANLMALALVVYRTGWTLEHWLRLGEPLAGLLPLHLCGLMFYLCAWMLWRRSYRVFEITWFWALGGTLLALVTPDLKAPFPSYLLLEYFVSHGVLVAALLYATLVFGFRPNHGSVWRAWWACLGYAAILFPLNFLLDANYMFLRAKPEVPTLLDALGPWPWYILTGAAVGLVAFYFWYLPFALAERYSAGASAAADSAG
jgi:hypothetical integral membrane protein (TIGR02206 family)